MSFDKSSALPMSPAFVLPASGTQESTQNSEKSFYGSGKFKWAIYPEHWRKAWGKAPVLGTVWANDAFHAVREAYNRGLWGGTDLTQISAVKLNPPPAFRKTQGQGSKPQSFQRGH